MGSNTAIPLISYTEVMLRKFYGHQPDLTIMEYLCQRYPRICFNFRKIVERGKIDSPNTNVHDCLLSWIDAGTSMKSGGMKLVLWIQASPPSKAVVHVFFVCEVKTNPHI